VTEHAGHAAPAPVRYCLLTTQRSGSTWLMSSLNAMPGVAGFLELFLPHTPAKDPAWLIDPHPPAFYDWDAAQTRRRPASTRAYLRHLGDWAPEARAVGFKLMINQGLRYYPEVPPLLRGQGYRLIVLTRDPMELAISRAFAQRTGISHRREAARPDPVRIDPAWARRDMRKRLREFRLARTLVRGLGFRAHWLDYSDLVREPEGQLRACARFLGLSHADPGNGSPLTKVVNAPYTEIVENYDEVAAIARELYGRPRDPA